ncbi:hypothetical protein PMW_164 [Pseudomonas phage phiPMW]|uniref:Uncharacterized protein n=1 Tax=Pseudomonas phage phiPMW TaxID=1815582 RepID=A0A1S5R1L1_9CAUD|nr:hypothetical protein FDG97_gp186 [Pseudomonas phage phiPMW]ANA49289.1 hypothetical protein PMW_164 [Pseudomonas phage phiPMW]
MREYTIVAGAVSLVVRVIGDVNAPAQPDADSDWDYYGGRETEFEILSGLITLADGERIQMTQDELDHILKWNEQGITKQVQHMIDIEDLI